MPERVDPVEQLTEMLCVGSDSDIWTQGDVYRLVLLPLAEEIARLRANLDAA